jgi:2-dehydro-3-deoxyphosphogluconate aldolase/(4S)-4-hydroxy-2-oxoglutarate aldolase
MARFSRVQVWSSMESLGLVPLFYNGDVETSKKIVAALSRGGAKVIEFTNRGDRAFEVFRDLIVHVEQVDPTVVLGVGSVLDVATAGLYINLGANFIVGSLLNPEVARLCNRRKVAYFPGCATPAEISEAEELGVEICKLFPGSQVGGPGFVKAIKGPCPWTKVMPTGGVSATRENLKGWFEAGVACVGIGSDLVRSEWVKAEEWDRISSLTAQCLDWIRQDRCIAV